MDDSGELDGWVVGEENSGEVDGFVVGVDNVGCAVGKSDGLPHKPQQSKVVSIFKHVNYTISSLIEHV